MAMPEPLPQASSQRQPDYVGQPNYQFTPGPPLIQQPNFDPPSPAAEPNQNQLSSQYNLGTDNINSEDAFSFKSPDPFYIAVTSYISNRYQLLLDASTPHWKFRWIFSLTMLCLFMIRIVVAQGWYIICYGLSIYYLNLFIGFLSPKIDPAFRLGNEFDPDDPDSDSGPMLPTRANDEFRPFIRRLPEFKFWLSATKATLISIFLTMFEAFDLPVFWPILLLYFILLFISTMRQQIKHMIRYGYVPWDKGKKKYGNKTEDQPSLFSTTI